MLQNFIVETKNENVISSLKEKCNVKYEYDNKLVIQGEEGLEQLLMFHPGISKVKISDKVEFSL